MMKVFFTLSLSMAYALKTQLSVEHDHYVKTGGNSTIILLNNRWKPLYFLPDSCVNKWKILNIQAL
jgi:hypothetical protein